MPIIAGAIGAPIAGSLIGQAMSSGDREAAEQARAKALQEILGIHVPDIKSQEIALADVGQVGELRPEMEQDILAGPSRFETISVDPRLKEAQMRALQELEEIGSAGGLRPEDQALLNQSRREVARDDRARRDSVLQNMAARGLGGSGMELAAQLASNQAAAERQSQESDRTGALASQRALEAIMNSGQLGGSIRGQDFSEQAQAAQAADAISQFNTANRLSLQARNMGARNQAQQRNLTEQQRVADTNVGQRNQETVTNKGLLQQQFSNQMARGQAAAGQQRQDAAANDASAAQTQQMWAGLGQAAGQGLTAYGGYKNAATTRADEAKQRELDRAAYLKANGKV